MERSKSYQGTFACWQYQRRQWGNYMFRYSPILRLRMAPPVSYYGHLWKIELASPLLKWLIKLYVPFIAYLQCWEMNYSA